MVLPSIPSIVLGAAVLLSARAHSLPHTSSSDGGNSGLLRVPIGVEKSNTQHIAKRQHPAKMVRIHRTKELLMNIVADDQVLTLAIDTASPWTWTNPNCDNAGVYQDLCKKFKKYIPKSNALSEKFPALYGNNAGGYIVPHSSNLKIGDLEVKDFDLGVAENSVNLHIGLLGLSPVRAGEKQCSILDSMLQKGVIKTRAFSIDMAHQAKDDQDTGSIIFSGIDNMRFSGTLETLAIQPPIQQPGQEKAYPQYFVKLDALSLSIGYGPFEFSKDLTVSLDTGSSHNFLPKQVVDEIRRLLLARDINGIWKVACPDKKTPPKGGLTYRFGKTDIVNEFASVIASPENPGDEMCQLRILESSNDQEAILGIPFFESAYTVFDQDNQKVYLAKAANCGSNLVPIEKGPNGVPLETGCK